MPTAKKMAAVADRRPKAFSTAVMRTIITASNYNCAADQVRRQLALITRNADELDRATLFYDQLIVLTRRERLIEHASPLA